MRKLLLSSVAALSLLANAAQAQTSPEEAASQIYASCVAEYKGWWAGLGESAPEIAESAKKKYWLYASESIDVAKDGLGAWDIVVTNIYNFNQMGKYAMIYDACHPASGARELLNFQGHEKSPDFLSLKADIKEAYTDDVLYSYNEKVKASIIWGSTNEQRLVAELVSTVAVTGASLIYAPVAMLEGGIVIYESASKFLTSDNKLYTVVKNTLIAVAEKKLRVDKILDGITQRIRNFKNGDRTHVKGEVKRPKKSGNCSFVANTPVLMADGSFKHIASVDVGEQVVSKNEYSGISSIQTVTGKWKEWHSKQVSLTYANNMGGSEVILTTPKHLFYVMGKGFMPASQLVSGMKVLQFKDYNGLLHQTAIDSGSATITLDQVEFSQDKPLYPAWNLTVANDHSYFVGNSKIWVHNECGPRLANEMPQDVKDEAHRVKNLPGKTAGKEFSYGQGKVTYEGNPANDHEYEIAIELAKYHQKKVVVRGKEHEGADFLIDGMAFEIKKIANSVNAVKKRIRLGVAQSDNVIIDGRKAGLTRENASEGVEECIRKGWIKAESYVTIYTATGRMRYKPGKGLLDD